MTYTPPTIEELVAAVRESDEKGNVLHEERGKAWRDMEAAIGQHRFMVSACERVEDERRAARHALQTRMYREAMRACE